MVEGFVIRRAKESDASEIAKMAIRLKKLNEEFDTQFQVDEESVKNSESIMKTFISDKDHVVLVGEKNRKVAGYLMALLRDRIFYVPKKEVRITDLYVMPEFRRSNLAIKLVEEMKKEASKQGISLITAEFPTLNVIALRFYKKIMFRETVSVYGAELE
ncbi:MAG: GNAT family N-acetyltransferase [Candidatus Thermoplasmatota archaeon]|jgi:ribosomal protein S18 acetylase RimI-like enzyme|nr:GNAT family N-acetyltransferase [Candidatus Thermoplasmatota archaeon]MCL5794424.1 GNAT family N-acetyltransferase [Candidatus Thermoplasmatota archaeon]